MVQQSVIFRKRMVRRRIDRSKEVVTVTMAMPSSSHHPQRAMIQKFIEALREQEFLDENFSNQRNLHENQNSLAAFCGDTEPKLATIEKTLHAENINSVDFPGVAAMMEQIKINAARVGGKRVAAACFELQQCCSANDGERSKDAYKKVTWEYYILRDCFHHILQAERTIHFSAEV